MSVPTVARRHLMPAVLGGASLWLMVVLGPMVGDGFISPPRADPGRSAAWYLTTFVISLLVATVLSVAQARQRELRLRSAVAIGALMGVLGVAGLLAAGINAHTMSTAGLRAAMLLVGVMMASAIVFASRRA